MKSLIDKNIIPRLIFWELTNKCNLKCQHCRGDMKDERSAGELNLDQIKNTIDNIVTFSKPIIVLTGGEPLFRPDVFDIASYAKEKGLDVALASNGTLISKDIAKKIVETGIRRVSISLDGSNADTHDNFRKISGSFEKALNGFKNLTDIGMNMQVNVTVAKHNINELDDMVKLALDLKADALHFFLLVPVGCGMHITKVAQIAPNKYEEVLNWIYDTSQRVPLELKATCAPHYYRIIKQRMAQEGQGTKRLDKKFPSSSRGCLAGTGILFISHVGDVQPCGYFPIKVGNVKEKSLSDMWKESKVFSDLRTPRLLKGKCRLCEYINICFGCRARAYGETGDYLEQEPYCIHIPKKASV